MASVGDIYGPKYMEKPALLNKLSHLDEYVVNGFLATLNKSDPTEIQKAIEMVCNNLSNRTNLPSETCDELLYDRPWPGPTGWAGTWLSPTWRSGAAASFHRHDNDHGGGGGGGGVG